VSSGIWIATAGAVAQSQALDATANNIANATTAGFKADRMTFKEALNYARSEDTAAVQTNSSRIDTQAGAMIHSENPLDVALEGDGYFSVDTEQGQRYTRAGNFQLDSTGTLITAEGHAVRGEAGQHIVVPPGIANVSIAPDGTVAGDGQTLGKLELAKFPTQSMKREGGTLYATSATPIAGEAPQVRSGMLEASNVNAIRGVVDLVKTSRNYESLMRVIQGFSEIESRAARDLGGPK
jgi:flagellar basal-body rod protein FlgF